MEIKKMSTKLERLLYSISPEIVLRPIFDQANQALIGFPLPDVVIENFGQYQSVLIRLHGRLEAKILGIDSMPTATVDFLWGHCYKILTQLYGPNGEKCAFDMIRTNKDGGFREVVNQFARTVAENYALNEIRAKITFYINGLSSVERLAAGAEYIEKFGHLLPEEMTELSAARIHDNFAEVLEKHPFMLYDLAKAAAKF